MAHLSRFTGFAVHVATLTHTTNTKLAVIVCASFSLTKTQTKTHKKTVIPMNSNALLHPSIRWQRRIRKMHFRAMRSSITGVADQTGLRSRSLTDAPDEHEIGGRHRLHLISEPVLFNFFFFLSELLLPQQNRSHDRLTLKRNGPEFDFGIDWENNNKNRNRGSACRWLQLRRRRRRRLNRFRCLSGRRQATATTNKQTNKQVCLLWKSRSLGYLPSPSHAPILILLFSIASDSHLSIAINYADEREYSTDHESCTNCGGVTETDDQNNI